MHTMVLYNTLNTFTTSVIDLALLAELIVVTMIYIEPLTNANIPSSRTS